MSGFGIAYLDKRAHPSCTYFVVGVSTTARGESYKSALSMNRDAVRRVGEFG